MLSAQSEFAKLCVFYLETSEASVSKVDKRDSYTSRHPAKVIFDYYKNPKLFFLKLKSLILILENGGLNHISKLHCQNDIFEYLSKYSKREIVIFQQLAELNLKSQNGWLSELPVLKTAGIFSVLYALFYLIYGTIRDTIVVRAIAEVYNQTSNFLVSSDIFMSIYYLIAFQLLTLIILSAVATILRIRRVYQARTLKNLIDVYAVSFNFYVKD